MVHESFLQPDSAVLQEGINCFPGDVPSRGASLSRTFSHSLREKGASRCVGMRTARHSARMLACTVAENALLLPETCMRTNNLPRPHRRSALP